MLKFLIKIFINWLKFLIMKTKTHISLVPTDQEFDLKLNFSYLLFLSSFLQQLSGSPFHLPPATKIMTTGKSEKTNNIQ